MKVFRIERKKYLADTLKGIGAALTDGFRWNSLNTHLVYTAESRALTILEMSVHLDLNEDFPTDRFYVEIDIPEEVDLLELKIEDLPKNWDAKPLGLETQYIGDDFVLQNEAAVLKVPSSIVPLEYNYLINPHHSQANKITVGTKQVLTFDQRLSRKKDK